MSAGWVWGESEERRGVGVFQEGCVSAVGISERDQTVLLEEAAALRGLQKLAAEVL